MSSEMTRPTIQSLMLIEVTTTDGTTTAHSIELPETMPEMEALVTGYVDRIYDPFLGGGNLIQLRNPVVIYNARHVVRVKFNYVGAADVQKAAEKAQQVAAEAQRKAGFHTPER